MQGRCFSSFQEDDGDGKIPVSALPEGMVIGQIEITAVQLTVEVIST
jgi:hypothetical protein